MANETNHKTVFVLDHTQYFGIAAEVMVDLDFGKGKDTADVLQPISKSLWTTSVESSVEYCRITWDLFPSGKLVRFVVSDANAHIVNTWNPATQNLTHVLNAMAMVGVPPRATHSADYSVIHGLRAAIEAIAEPTKLQRQIIDEDENGKSGISNKGRVICITSARDDASMKSLEDIFQTVIEQQNAITVGPNNNMLNIDFCHLVIVNLFPTHMESMVSNRKMMEISPSLHTEIHSVRASDIPKKLTHLIMEHYHLASTTVTGIPMKEEQNASSSANYDVEIFHESNSHNVINPDEIILPSSSKEGAEYKTVTLKWCTPRGAGASDLQPCIAQHRVTPVDVTSRPSSCLTNFLLSGRSVMLEMPKVSGGKLNTHLLSAHGGEIFIHTLDFGPSIFEDMPSLCDLSKPSTLRTQDFIAHMRRHRLHPIKDRQPDVDMEKLVQGLMDDVEYFPVSSKTTIVYNMQRYLEPVMKAISKKTISDEEVFACKNLIFAVLNAESKNEALPMSNVKPRNGMKKEEQYRLLWTELELIVRKSGDSQGHKEILDTIRSCGLHGTESASKSIDIQLVVSGAPTETARASVIRATTDSPLSPTFAKKSLPFPVNKMSLLEIVNTAAKIESDKRVEFSGRMTTPIGQITKLYPNFGVGPKEPIDSKGC